MPGMIGGSPKSPPKNEKKQLLLRLSPALWDEINRWAEDDFRSINGQIEYILSDAVKKRRKTDVEDASSRTGSK